MARRAEATSRCDTPAGLAAKMGRIGSEAAVFLSHVKGFELSGEAAAIEAAEVNTANAGYLYFDRVAREFQAFRAANPDYRRAHLDQAASDAIYRSFDVLSELARACGAVTFLDAARKAAVPTGLASLSEEALGRIMDSALAAVAAYEIFKAPARAQSRRAAARGRDRREVAAEAWSARVFAEAVEECAAEKRVVSRTDLMDLICRRLQEKDPEFNPPGDAEILRKMAEWELQGLYVRYDPRNGRSSRYRPTTQSRARDAARKWSSHADWRSRWRKALVQACGGKEFTISRQDLLRRVMETLQFEQPGLILPWDPELERVMADCERRGVYVRHEPQPSADSRQPLAHTSTRARGSH